MQIVHSPNDRPLKTRALLESMLSPLCGLDQRIGFMMRSAGGPRFCVAGAELTGVHLLCGRQRPRPGAYHIGGSGVFLEECVIRSLGETAERYSQLVSERMLDHTLQFATYRELTKAGKRVIDPAKLQYFTPQQLNAPGFRFRSFNAETPLAWIPMMDVRDWEQTLVPAQLVLVGYNVRADRGEEWLMTAVTNGTAAHSDFKKALRSAILELVQIDAAMGHWFSSQVAPEVALDGNARGVQFILDRYWPSNKARPKFFLLQTPDLPGTSVACVLSESRGEVPAVSVGLGIDLSLSRALYKALIEAIGVSSLAKIAWLYREATSDRPPGPIDPDRIFDLETNVVYYANPANAARVRAKFAEGTNARAPATRAANATADEELGLLVKAFIDSGKSLLVLDITAPEIRELGISVARAWSPDLISLPLPSAPPLAHGRFAAYGGAAFPGPHPYP